MSNKFLSLIADEVLKKIILKKRNVAIVLPSKRSIQHLKKEISISEIIRKDLETLIS